MKKDTVNNEHVSITSRDVLTEILRQGAQEMLAMAIENEVVRYLADHQDLRDDQGHCLVARNGHLPVRMIQTGLRSAPHVLQPDGLGSRQRRSKYQTRREVGTERRRQPSKWSLNGQCRLTFCLCCVCKAD